MADDLKTYFNKLKEYDSDTHTEGTSRTPLENLFDAIITQGVGDRHIDIIHEPTHDRAGGGAPDFMFNSDGSIIGYLETKKIGENLDKTLKSDQLKKYKELSDNIILTNYHEWIWIYKSEVTDHEHLCDFKDISNKKSKLDSDRAEKVLRLISNFLTVKPKSIDRAKDLAIALAKRCHSLREFLEDELKRQEKEHREGKLFGLYDTFKENIFNELTLPEFADAFSQMLGYGLFLGRLNAESKKITLVNIRSFIPQSFELIRELVNFLDELNEAEYHSIRWQVGEILSILNNLDLAALKEDLSFSKKPKKTGDEEELFAKDPYIYFYEDFLHKYDPEKSKSRGVYYTPPPVVNFIVRAINDILKGEFGISDGLANEERVTVLDFATGTGTFLVEVFQQIFDELPKDSGKWELIIKEHILKNIYGFEYMIGPYTVAHLKLSQFLKEKGYELTDKERFQIYLTNTLEQIDKDDKQTTMDFLLPALAKEGKEAQEIKKKPILVITGNPPYSVLSRNKGKEILKIIKKYFEVDGEPLGERNPKNLLDDYVKFIRFAQHKMESVEEGVVGIITNHSFLDNPTFRGMRQSLMETFNQIYLLDLHGNSKKKEKAPDGGKDENVFDIEQGVSISIFVKKKELKRRIAHADVWGKRDDKYRFGCDNSLNSVEWKDLNPSKPFYFFIPRDDTYFEMYQSFWSVKDIFISSSVGISTFRDKLTIDFNDKELWKRVNDFNSLPEEEARRKYNLGKDSRDWKISYAQQSLTETGPSKENIMDISYRPFDTRKIYYTTKSKGFICMPRYDVMQHMLLGGNIGLITNRQIRIGEVRHTFITNKIVDSHIMETAHASAHFFPLYIYDELDFEPIKSNFNDKFLNFVQNQYSKEYSPEEILYYIYAVTYSPTYREKYQEFLKYDFPRIPFVESAEEFEALSALGGELIEAHLMKNIPNLNMGDFMVEGERNVTKPRYVEAEERLYINKTQYFNNVPTDVWEFHIGGYQVIDKYLKYRKESAINRPLNLDEIQNIENVIKILAFTIEQMKKIDTVFNCP